MQKSAGSALLLAVILTVSAQSTLPTFEVATVKRNISGSGSATSGLVQGDRVTSTNVTLNQMVRTAYSVQEFQIAGQPSWFNTERFDVQAKIPRDAKREDWPLMFQALLADRFKLVLHKENRSMSVLDLVVAKNGPKLTAADRSKCDPSNPSNACGFRASPTEIVGTSVSMAQLATRLSRSLGMIVLDKTELKGEFDLEIRWTNDEGVPLPRGASAGPALYPALQEQLGLRLQSTKAPVETLVIDRVQSPTEN